MQANEPVPICNLRERTTALFAKQARLYAEPNIVAMNVTPSTFSQPFDRTLNCSHCLPKSQYQWEIYD